MTEELKQAALEATKHATVLSDGEVRHYAMCCVTTEDAIRAAEQKVLERALTAAQPAQAERDAWVPYLVDRADGVKGHYAIGRWNPRGYREVWNLHSHRWAAYSDDVMSLEEADSLLRQITIPTARASLPTQPAAQADSMGMPTSCGKPLCSPDEHHQLCKLRKPAAQATPEPVGEVLQFPPMPEGWPARFRCDSCDGNGEIGELVSMGHFQPPERQTCPDCGGRGWASEEHAFNADHMREFAEAHALLTRPEPGVPEGFDVQAHVATGGGHEYPLITVRDTSTQVGEDVFPDEHPVIYGLLSAVLAAAQAKGADK